MNTKEDAVRKSRYTRPQCLFGAFLLLAQIGLTSVIASPSHAQGDPWGLPHKPGELLVGLRPGTVLEVIPLTAEVAPIASTALPSAVKSQLTALGAVSARTLLSQSALVSALSGVENFPSAAEAQAYWVITFPVSADLRAAAEALVEGNEVLYAEPNLLLSLEASPNDLYFASRQWNLRTFSEGGINATGAWDLQTGSRAAKIAIIDTGIDFHQDDLGNGSWGYQDFSKVTAWQDYLSSQSTPYDDHYHGTVLATIAAGYTNNIQGPPNGMAGIAGGWGFSAFDNTGNPGAKVVSLKVANSNNTVDVAAASAAIIDAANPSAFDADILLLAWGVSGSSANTIQTAVEIASRQNCVIVTSKGNENRDTFDAPHFPSDIQYGRWTISVGATNNARARGQYPMPGWKVNEGSNFGGYIDLVAPGTAVFTGTPTTQTSAMVADGINAHFHTAGLSGTSIAAAHVAGAAALVVSEAAASSNPLHPDEIQGILNASAADIGAPGDGYDNSYGNGLLDVGAAVARLRAPYTLNRFATSGGTGQTWSDMYLVNIHTHEWPYTGKYRVRRVPVRKTIQFNATYASPPMVFGRGVNASTGWGDYPYSIFNSGFCRVISTTATSAELETFVYYVWNLGGQDVGYVPCEPQLATFAYSVLGVPADTTAPAAVTDLAASSGARTSSAVSWTAPGDDGSTGQAHHFDLRRSTSPITSGNFAQATPVTIDLPTPGPAGTLHCMVVDGLSSCHSHYFAIKTVDEVGNTSLVSNSSAGTTACSGYSFAYCDGGPLAGGGEEEGPPTGQLESTGTMEGLPVDFSLGVQTPNPGAGHMSMKYALPRPGPVRIDVYSVDGRLMKSLVDASEHPAGVFEARWDGSMTSGGSVPSGMYFYRMRAGGMVRETRGLLLN